MDKKLSTPKDLVLEELNLLIEQKKLELQSFEDKMKEYSELLNSIDIITNIYNQEKEKLNIIKEEITNTNKEKFTLINDNKCLIEHQYSLKSDIEHLEKIKIKAINTFHLKGKEYELLKSDLLQINQEISVRQNQRSKLGEDIIETENKLENIKHLQIEETQNLNEVQNKKQAIAIEINKITIDRSDLLNQIKNARVELNEIDLEKKLKNEEIDNLFHSRIIIEQRYEKDKDRLNLLQTEFIEAQKKLGTELAKLDIAEHALMDITNQTDKNRTELINLDHTLNTKKQELLKFTNQINDFEKIKNNLETEINRIKIDRNSISNILNETKLTLDKLFSEEKSLKGNLNKIVDKITEKTREIEILDENINNLNLKCIEFSKSRDNLLSINQDLNEKNNKLAIDIENKIKFIEVEKESISKLNTTIDLKEKQILDHNNHINGLTNTIKELEHNINNLKVEIGKNISYKKDLKSETDEYLTNKMTIKAEIELLLSNRLNQESLLNKIKGDIEFTREKHKELLKMNEVSEINFKDLNTQYDNLLARLKDKEAHLLYQDREISRLHNNFHNENHKMLKLREDINKYTFERELLLKEIALIKSNMELSKKELDKVNHEISDVKSQKNSYIAENFIKEVKNIYQLKKENLTLKSHITELTETIKKAS